MTRDAVTCCYALPSIHAKLMQTALKLNVMQEVHYDAFAAPVLSRINPKP